MNTKRLLALLAALAIIAWLAYRWLWPAPATVTKTPDTPMNVARPAGPLEDSVQQALNAYYDLKDALVASDADKAQAAAQLLQARLQAIPMADLQADEAVVSLAGQLQQTIVAETQGLAGEATLEGKRRSFQMISDALYDMLRTMRYGAQTVYQQYCPMAFDNQGAAWLSRETEILNPYFGDKMLHCGEVRDSIHFAR